MRLAVFVLTNFNDALPRLEGGFDGGESVCEGSEQGFLAAVSETQPDKPSSVRRSCGEDEEVFIFGDDDPIFGLSRAPDLTVVGLSFLSIQNVDGVVAIRTQPAGERGWQLVIDDESHANQA